MTEQNHRSADEVKKDASLLSGEHLETQSKTGEENTRENMPVDADNHLPADPKPNDPINEMIPCECGSKDHKAGLIIKKWGTLEDGTIEDKVKVQIFDGDSISTVAINKKKLLERLNEFTK